MSKKPAIDRPAELSVLSTALTTGSSIGKRAGAVARRILADVVALGWPVGTVLGSEGELLERYGVSRAVFREAVRIVENQGVAQMRRGPSGGLVITEPSSDSARGALFAHLYKIQPGLDEVFQARIVMEEIAVELASTRMSEKDIYQLRRLVADEASGEHVDHRALHDMLASISRNPAVDLFVRLLNNVMVAYFPRSAHVAIADMDASIEAHRKIAAAVVARDGGLARRRMRKHLEAEAAFLRGRRVKKRITPPPISALGGKLASRTARQILIGVVADGWKVGTPLGSEPELMEQLEVSRAVFREAIRILEHHQVVSMRRGPGGGLFVAEPSIQAVSEAVALYLERQGITRSHLIELREALECVQVTLAVERLDKPGLQRLVDTLEVDPAAAGEHEELHDLHVVVASLAGNRVLELVTVVLVRLSSLHVVHVGSDRVVGAALVAAAADAHTRIVEAMIDGDVELATYRMRRHIDACGRFFRPDETSKPTLRKVAAHA